MARRLQPGPRLERHGARPDEARVEIEPVSGRKVVEARPHGAQKGLAAAAVRAETPEVRILAIGDDRTDEDMFATTLAGGGIAGSVGDHDSRARLHVTGTADVRQFLD